MSGIFVLNSAMPTLIPWAFTSTLLILAVLTVRWLTRNRLSSVNRYALWAVVLIRLLDVYKRQQIWSALQRDHRVRH